MSVSIDRLADISRKAGKVRLGLTAKIARFFRVADAAVTSGFDDPEAPGRRRVVFLQGPAGRTFEKVGREFLTHGHGVFRVNFNMGDQLCWRLPGAVAFRGFAKKWPDFFDRLLLKVRATDVVLFGDCRPLHRVAIQVARRNGVAVHVLEEGYIRPNWVTLEADGVNGNSRLPRDPEWYLRQAQAPVVDGIVEQPYSFARRAFEDVVYNLSRLAGWPAYPFFHGHRPWHPLVEYAGWIRRLAAGPMERRRSAFALDSLRAGGKPYFLFPLQLDCDFQIRVHSPYGAIQPALRQVLASFARFAPRDAVLVVKQHPLENGLRDWRSAVTQLACTLGIENRIVFIEVGNLQHLLQGARGMVTINSTSGMDALAAQVPLIALGNAVYDLPGLTNGKNLDIFWTQGQKPDAELLDAFRAVLVQRCLIPGGFYSDEGIESIVAGVVKRLEIHGTPQQADSAKRVMALPVALAEGTVCA